MKFKTNVIHKGTFYPAGTDVPVGDSVNIEPTDNAPNEKVDVNAGGTVNTYDAEGNVARSLSPEEVEELQKEASAAFEVQDKTKRGRKSKEE